MNTERIKEIQEQTDYPESVSVQQALLKVWNETEQEQLRIGAVSGSVNDILDTIHDNLIDNGFDCYNKDGSLKDVDDYKLTFKMVADELRKHYR